MDNNYWFEDKRAQVDIDELIAFGISIGSRYGNASELCQMLMFARECAKAGVSHQVARAFYDSKACICDIDLTDDQYNSSIGDSIKQAAMMTLAQFTWNGEFYAGAAP